MDPNKIIDNLGGTAKVAHLCKVKPPSVSQWRINGIPEARLMFLKAIRPEVFDSFDSESEPNKAAA